MQNEIDFCRKLTEKLKELRDEHRYTQPDVADRIGIGVSAYKSYELGMRRIPVDVLMRVAALYNVSMDELLGNSDVRDDAPKSIIHGKFSKAQLQKIQKYADLVGDDEL